MTWYIFVVSVYVGHAVFSFSKRYLFNDNLSQYFLLSLYIWAHLCLLHGGLLCIAFCLSVCHTFKNSYLRKCYSLGYMSICLYLLLTTLWEKFMSAMGMVLLTGRAHFPSFPSFCLQRSVLLKPLDLWACCFLSMYITYISVSKSTPLAVTGPHGQLASTVFYLQLICYYCASHSVQSV